MKFYHNPDCSKSRAALALLEENDYQVEVIYYLDEPPSIQELQNIAAKIGVPVRDLLRKSEGIYEQFELGNQELSETIVLDIVSKHPILIQRPILVHGNKAVIGRPPEKVLALAKGEL